MAALTFSSPTAPLDSSPAPASALGVLDRRDLRISELGFADIDNDGVTDVLWRDSSGNVLY